MAVKLAAGDLEACDAAMRPCGHAAMRPCGHAAMRMEQAQDDYAAALFIIARNNMNDTEIEQEIIAKGLTAPRVTLAQIEAVIMYEYYMNASQMAMSTTPVFGPAYASISPPDASLSLLTLCVLVLNNGFTVTGESACASPENFDAELGRKIARQKAIDKVWAFEGYLLKQVLWEQGLPDCYEG